jgi:hypothetical protein
MTVVPSEVGYGVEGVSDVPVAEKLIRYIHREPRQLSISGSSSKLDAKIRKWNSPSLKVPILVLRDWDERDGVGCAPELLAKVLGGNLNSRGLVVRIPVRSLESWLLADGEAFEEFFGTSKLPIQPDDELHPKLLLVNVCRKSKKSWIRDAVVPTQKSGRIVGTLYAPTIIKFATDHWDPVRAAAKSPSLKRALNRLSQLADEGTI